MDPSAERDSSSEEELDYMSDAVLQAAEDALQKSRSLTGRRPAKMVTKKRYADWSPAFLLLPFPPCHGADRSFLSSGMP